MSQEMNIVCCYSCEMFQVHIVKRAKKWKCKICNAKQSIRRVYFEGSGKDCRLHVQQLNSQKQKGFESVQTSDSNTGNTNYISYDNGESSSGQQICDNWSNEYGEIFDDAMQVFNEEYTSDEQTIDNDYKTSGSNLSQELTYECKSFDDTSNTSSEIKDSEIVSSESTCYVSDNIEIKSTINDTKENDNIFESYEDFDVVLDF